ncbi:hypothetical protein G6F64_001345 [Rhizopus arrhizus]|uniref:Reverse transcriptase domain-containing protein n=1 Tax=Rhizopus oryzae TaxID=64495 RepID=A0A9P6XIG0_RHIOR|nr:hypothetical protein G6F64_001345 [Rhizopus arrhizus]
MQETHAAPLAIQESLNMLLQTKSACWSANCGIASLNSDITINPVLSAHDHRFLLASIEHKNFLFTPFHILTLYAPANPSERRRFYLSLVEFDPLVSFIQTHSGRLIITGDFNYSPVNNLGAPPSWRTLLEQNMLNCMASPMDMQPTFRRDTSLSTIDYIYASPFLHSLVCLTSIDFINSSWTDHALLSVSLKFCNSSHGPGLWRMNPNLMKNKKFVNRLSEALATFSESIPSDPIDPQFYWDQLKQKIQQVARSFGRRQASWRNRQLRRLQSKRNRMLRQYRTSGILSHLLSVVENQIGSLQEEITANNILRAGRYWREHGERSAGYLKRTIESRSVSRHISSLKESPESEITSDANEMQSIAKSFYQNLYSCEPVSFPQTENILTHITEQDRLSAAATDSLLEPFTYDDLLQASARCPKASSPGNDGLPYEALSFVFRTESLQPLVLSVYNQALLSGLFPPSWTSTCTVLLPKKGDLNLLRNWRPISLINTDAKVFTRLLSGRILGHCSHLIHDVQKGFMPHRFIGDNGLMMQLVKTEAEQRKSSEIGLLLDQEKAYDRVHPDYLRKVMLKFGFPASFVSTICHLFFETQIHINLNGFITSPFTQERGLRQGDPLSPVLFNIAFDPFLRSIENDSILQGFQFHPATNSSGLHLDPPPPVKVLAYADDVAVFLRNQDDFDRLCVLYDTYAQASNANLNLNKTEAFSLSGNPHPQWQIFLSSQGISTWHDYNSPAALRYLGFAIYSSITQRNGFINDLLLKINHACALQSQRQLSFRGRVTVMNTLIYSKLWYVLRLLSVPRSTLKKFASIGYQFVTQKVFPKLKHEFLFANRPAGGLKLLDPSKQQLVLQWKWIRPLILVHNHRSFTKIILYLTYSIKHHFNTADHLLPLLFPSCRTGALGNSSKLNIFTNIFQAMDALGRCYQDTHISPATSFQLALPNVIRFSNPLQEPIGAEPSVPNDPSPPFARLKLNSWGKIQVSDAFTYDHRRGYLRRKTRTELTSYPRLIARFFRAIDNQDIWMEPFFLRLCLSPSDPALSIPLGTIDLNPFVEGLLPSYLLSSQLKTAQIRQVFSPQYEQPVFDPPISERQWKMFWNSNIPFKARDVWYRVLHNKLSCQLALHHAIPTIFEDPSCPLCSTNPENSTHFLYSCQYKHPIWEYLWDTYFDTPFSQPALHRALFSLQFPKVKYIYEQLSPFQFIACTLLAIWSSHWSVVFSESRFALPDVIKLFNKHLASYNRSE